MCHIGHIRYAIHGFFPLFFRDLYVIQAYREMYGFVELVYFLEFIHLSINNKCDQDAKSYDFTVKMIFLYDRVIGQRIEYGVGQTGVQSFVRKIEAMPVVTTMERMTCSTSYVHSPF